MSASEHCIYRRVEAVPDVPPSGNSGSRPRLRMVPRSDGPIKTSAALDAVVIATDFSEHAAYAASRVAVLAEEVNMSKVTVLHILERSCLGSLRQMLRASSSAESERPDFVRRRLAGAVDHVRKRTGLAVESRVAAGGTVSTIHRFAALADLVVIGAQGTHPLRDFLIGSTAQRLLRRTSQPVLVVRRRPEAPYRRVLIAVDFRGNLVSALDYAEILAPRATLNLVHAYHVPFEGKMRYAGASGDVIDSYRAEARTTAARDLAALVLSRTSPAVKRTLIVHGHSER